MRVGVLLAVSLLLLGAPSGLLAQDKVKPIVEWVGEVSDKGLMQNAPRSGFITNPIDLETLWRAWRGQEKPPTIDFDGHMVVVGLSDIPISRLSFDLKKTGDLEFFTQVPNPFAKPEKGFCYGMAVIPRAGITSVLGNPLIVPGELTLRGHKGTVWSVAFSPDGKLLATASHDKTVRLWDRRTGKELAALQHAEWVYVVAFSPDGKLLASPDGNGNVVLWDVAERKKFAIMSLHKDRVRGLAFTPDGKTLASAGWDKKVVLSDVATAKERVTISLNTGSINSVAISPDGKTGAAVGIGNGSGKVVSLWSVETGRVFEALKPSGTYVAFSPDGKTLVATLWIWDWTKPSELRKLMVPEEHDVNAVVYSPDGKRIATAGADRTIRLWDAATGLEVASFKGHTKSVTSVAFSPDGKLLASTSLDETVRIWPLK